jgi:acetyl esterase/lipase
MSFSDYRSQPRRPDLKDLMSQFVSLGINCELGQVQRHCDSDLLGLFRFGLTPMAGLIEALDSSFESIANPDLIQFKTLRDGEFISVHQRYGVEFHTGMNVHKTTEDFVREKLVRHFTYLSRMLLEEISHGEKIFVYRPRTIDTPESDARLLLASLRRHGPAVLLWAAWSDDPARIGTVEWRVPGELMVGYLDRYSPINYANDLSWHAWLSICEAAAVLRAASPTRAVPHAADQNLAKRVYDGPTIADVSYGDHPRQKIDIFQGAGPGPHRPVFFLHGGGYVAGSKHDARQLAAKIVPAGYAVVGINYRLSPDTDIAGIMQDAAGAIAHTMQHAEKYGLDTSRVAILGDSAGGQLAGLIATDPTYLRAVGVDPASLAAVVTLEGIFDVVAHLKPGPAPRLEAVFGLDEAAQRNYSPLTHVPTMQTSPVFYLIHQNINNRFVIQTQNFAAALRARNFPVVTAVAPGLKHPELMRFFADDDRPMAGFVLECLNKHLRTSQPQYG